MSESKAYDYMMYSLKRIIRFVEEVSNDWWWLEQGNLPIISVRKLVVNDGDVKLELLPKRSVFDALKIIEENFNKIRNLPPEVKVDFALKVAQDLYSTLQAIMNIIDAHELAEKLIEIRNRVSRLKPEAIDEFLDKINAIIALMRELIVTNVFGWPKNKKKIETRIAKLLEELEGITKTEKEVIKVEENSKVSA